MTPHHPAAPRQLLGVSTPYRARWLTRPARSRPGALAAALFSHARTSLLHLKEPGGDGVFLENGSHLATNDLGNLVVSTAECADPWAAIAQQRAGERCLLDLLTGLGSDVASSVVIEHADCGMREWFYPGLPDREFAEQLVPHLVSRAVYSGAGGFDPTRAALRFVLSPAAFADTARVNRIVVAEPRRHRRRLPWQRGETLPTWFEVAAGEQPSTDVAAVLSLGTSTLIALLAMQGREPAASVRLQRPLQAWRAFSSDPPCKAKARTVEGRSVCALDIQAHYLEQVDRFARELPDWTARLVPLWRSHLDELGRGITPATLRWPMLEQGLDAAIRGEPGWRGFGEWNERWKQVMRETGRLGANDPDSGYSENDTSRTDEAIEAITRWCRKTSMNADSGARYYLLRCELLRLEAESRGVFAASTCNSGRLFGEAEIAHARVNPPVDTRAGIRGKWVRRLGTQEHRARFRADWTNLSDMVAGTEINLSDPLAMNAEWESASMRNGQGELFGGIKGWFNTEF